ncbi:MAG: sulfate reduction electron transfer complex DsrMKJOP subunit DsrO [Desulfovibrio sp.]|jgi:molybdopterin-containing oxidoreductase family iron-sulfur binding subunit
MKRTRRSFLKFAGATAAAGLCFSPALSIASGSPGHGSGPKVTEGSKHAQRWAMVIDTNKINTKEQILELEKACHVWHNVPHIVDEEGNPTKQELKWIWGGHFHEVFTEKHNNFPAEEIENREYPLLCNHCENPPCVRVCPTKATYQRPDGIVAMDYHRCIGCRYCMAGCPFGARSFNFMDPRPYLHELNKDFPTRTRGVVEKCNFCVDRLALGMRPACVEKANEIAPGAMFFGDLLQEDSEVRQALREHFTIRRKPSAGTEPGVYYII